MADKGTRAKTETGGLQSSAITNDDEYTYVEQDNGYADYVDKTIAKTKDPRSY